MLNAVLSVSPFAGVLCLATPALPLSEEKLVPLSICQCPASQDSYSFLESHVVPAAPKDLWDSLLEAR